MQNGVQRAAGIGGNGQGQGDFQHTDGQGSGSFALAVMPPPIQNIGQKHQDQAENICRQSPQGDGGTTSFYVPAGGQIQAESHQKDTGQLLDQVDQGGFPDPAAGSEVAGDGGAEGDAGHAPGGKPQAHDRAGVPDPEKADGLCQQPQHRRGGQAEQGSVAQAAAHGPADAAAVVAAQLLGHQAGGGKADAGDGKGGPQVGDGADQLIQPDARRADASHQPHLKGDADAAHQQGRTSEQGSIIDQALSGDHRQASFRADGEEGPPGCLKQVYAA